MLLLEKVYGAHAVTSDIILVTQCDSLWRKRKTQVSKSVFLFLQSESHW
jgi:hypothetical protein